MRPEQEQEYDGPEEYENEPYETEGYGDDDEMETSQWRGRRGFGYGPRRWGAYGFGGKWGKGYGGWGGKGYGGWGGKKIIGMKKINSIGPMRGSFASYGGRGWY